MISHKKINALILAGGKSSRMKEDKGTIAYHGVNQVAHLNSILKQYVNEVYVSIREEQKNDSHLENLKILEDKFQSRGPIVGIMSAFMAEKCPWLVIAVDLPYVDQATIEQLLEEYDSSKLVTCFENPEKKWAEPLFSIYSPEIFTSMKEYFDSGSTCARKFIKNLDIKMICPVNQKALINANTPDEKQEIINQLKVDA